MQWFLELIVLLDCFSMNFWKLSCRNFSCAHKFTTLQVALPLESTTGTCFLQHYIESILALQEASCKLGEGLLAISHFAFSYLKNT